jgi:NADH:ubiquinone oxidoreductase subunit 3 (subunit A)
MIFDVEIALLLPIPVTILGCQGHLLCHVSLTVGLFAIFILTLHLLLNHSSMVAFLY